MDDRDSPMGRDKGKQPVRVRRKGPATTTFSVAPAIEPPVEQTVAPEPIVIEAAAPEPVETMHQQIETATSPVLGNDVSEAVPATAAASEEGTESMATIMTPTPSEATDKAQAMFGDMSTRFKTAFEKSTKMNEDMVELAKGNVEALVASARVAAKAGETLGQEAAEYGKKSFESAVAHFKSVASVKSPTELFQLQSEFAKSSFDTVIAEASKFSETMLKIAGEVAQPLSSRYAVAAEKIKSATL